MNKKARLIACYLPQFHPIPENDEWWGKGFTEWTNVAMAKPLYRGHYQPKIPADLGFYDLRLSEVREAQAQMARSAGVEGFMYWHYWFGNGKQLLEKPFNEVLTSGKPDFPFCLGWANHSWSRKTWTAKKSLGKSTMLLEQTYNGEEDYIDHFYNVLPAFKDHRYITVDGKPFFLIFNVLDIPDLNQFLDLWQKLAKKNGLKGIHFVGNVSGMQDEFFKDKILSSGVNSAVINNLAQAERKCSESKIKFYIKKVRTRLFNIGAELYSYKDIINNYHNDYELKDNVYPTVFAQIDYTPRQGKNALVLRNSTPDLFEKFIKDTIDQVKHKDYEHRIIMLNAWNEWGEGSYVEPDMKFGHGYLDAMKNVLNS